MPQDRKNHLAGEKSPYLQQHVHNPVDWYPWGDLALERAQRENRLIFLSIGYSTCHWCHVMERESFEDQEVAAELNRSCISIKVDREERPDLDQVYMAVCQALNGTGGWPLNLLLTPDRVPFFAGTYLPKRSRDGRIGLIDAVRQAAELWQQQPDRVRHSAQQVADHLRHALAADAAAGEVGANWANNAVAALGQTFDARWGGFAGAPKFPTPHTLTFLLRRWRRDDNPRALEMTEQTLDAMRRGGIWDQVGFGFHRYSTDAQWLLPHFEKMLYDQAGLLTAYAEAHLATGSPRFASVADEIIEYLLRDLATPEGAFYAAEDADSEGVEGKFYLWTRQELIDVLGATEGELYCQAYGIEAEGNFRDEASGRRDGNNIPHLPRSPADQAAQLGLAPDALTERMECWRRALLPHRARRVRPRRDDKVLCSWNGLAVTALARAGWTLERTEVVDAARRCADFLLRTLYRDGCLRRRYCAGEAAIDGFAEDYACLARGLLDLYCACFDPSYLSAAVRLATQLQQHFTDPERGDLYDTAHDAEALLLRPKTLHDGATPSANAVAVEVYARLGLLTGEPAWSSAAHDIARALAPTVSGYETAFTQFLQGLSWIQEPTRQLVLAGDPEAADTRRLLQAVQQVYAPETSLLLAPPGDVTIEELAPFSRAMLPRDGHAAVYVCEGQSCRTTITDPDALRRLLQTPPEW